jgi:hypothetical protein
MPEIYHRTLAGKVTWIGDLTSDEAAEAIARAPWEWHTAPRGFAPWPAGRVRAQDHELIEPHTEAVGKQMSRTS